MATTNTNKINRFFSKLRLATKAFSKTMMTADLLREDDFGDVDVRRLRYDINWSFYENTVYDDIHNWAVAYRSQYGLSKLIRGIYNPVYRLGEFWVGHIWGGQFDWELGDGLVHPTSLPLSFEPKSNPEAIKRGLKQIYRWSNWQVRKNLLVRYGTVLGDVGVRVVDDTQSGRIYNEIIHPGDIVDYTADNRGNILDYTLEQERIDPEDELGRRTVVYREEVVNKDGDIYYATFRDGEEYPWFGNKSQWKQEYGFTPFILLQHMDIGEEWGWSEFHPLRTKIHHLDDIATSLGNWVRTNAHAPWLFSGVRKPASTPKTEGATPDTDSRYPVKDNMRALYAPIGSSAQELVSKMPVEEVVAYINVLLEEIERDFPELSKDLWENAQETSARATRIKRQRTEKKAEERRSAYDDALRRLNMMGLSIAGMRQYGEAFEGITQESYDAGQLDHSVANRPVFARDELEDLEIEKAFWDAAKVAREAGFSLETWLKRKGWTDEEINEWKDSEEYEIRMKLQSMALDQETLKPLQDTGGRPEENGAGKEKNSDRE